MLGSVLDPVVEDVAVLVLLLEVVLDALEAALEELEVTEELVLVAAELVEPELESEAVLRGIVTLLPGMQVTSLK